MVIMGECHRILEKTCVLADDGDPNTEDFYNTMTIGEVVD